MEIENLGLDFDGVLRKWPGFLYWYVNFLSPNDLLVRAKLFFLRKWLFKFFSNLIPTILDGDLIETIKREQPRRIILVSGRCSEKEQQRIFKLLKPYLHIDKFYFRDNCSESEEMFKERVLRKEKVSFFIEDRAYVVRYLRNKGIEAYHISEIRE